MTERNEAGQFRCRVDVRHGYLSYLAAEPALRADGVMVNVVGRGTPLK